MPKKAETGNQVVKPIERKIALAAEEVILTYGFHGCTIDRVIEKAHVSRGTLFKYFNGKSELFATVVRNIAASIKKELAQILNTLSIASPDPATVVRGFLTLFSDDASKKIWKRARIVATTIVELKESMPELLVELSEGIGFVNAMMADLFHGAGIPKEQAEHQAEQFMCLIIGGLLMVRVFNDERVFRHQIHLFRDRVMAMVPDGSK